MSFLEGAASGAFFCMCELFKNERIDDLQVGGLKMIQAESGYRFSLDPFLLADFIDVRDGDEVVDLGTASGVLPLLLASTTSATSVVGVELQEALYDRAKRNIVLNNLSDKVDFKLLDVREIVNGGCLGVESFDVVVMNPPYRAPLAGRVSRGNERAICRHELHGNIVDFLRAACWLVRQGGSINVVFLAERLPELLGEMKSCGLEPKRLRLVHSDRERDAHLVLVEARKGGRPGLKVQPPLYIYVDCNYSDEIRRIFDAVPTAEQD